MAASERRSLHDNGFFLCDRARSRGMACVLRDTRRRIVAVIVVVAVVIIDEPIKKALCGLPTDRTTDHTAWSILLFKLDLPLGTQHSSAQ